ncbi:MAG: hypothetical protein ACP5XB_19330, partial [Isosphaeraceae bacterium]
QTRPGPARLLGTQDNSAGEPPAIYEVADSVQNPAPRGSEASSNIFVRSRGSSSEWVEGPTITRRRQRRSFILRLLLLAFALFAGWYFATRRAWLKRR